MSAPRAAHDTIVLLHGLAAPGWVMRPMTWRLGAAGYRVENWSYRSLRDTIEIHGERLHARLAELDGDPSLGRLHLVAHSMGCIVSRQALALGKPRRLGRVVLLAPPNHGAYLATFFGPWLRWGCRTIDQLATRPDSYVNRLPPMDDVEFGVIAARYDLLVPRFSTHLVGERAHETLMALHGPMVLQRNVARHVVHFLREGCFAASKREPSPASSVVTESSRQV